MKKVLFMVALAAISLGEFMAQNVQPLNIELTQFSIDTIRANSETVEAYLTQLNTVSQAVAADKQALDNAAKTLKSEQNYYKQQSKIFKDRQKQYNNQEKAIKNEEKTDKKERKAIEKQRKELQKNEVLDNATLQANYRALDGRIARLDEAESIRSRKMLKLQDQREVLKNDMIELEQYNFKVQDKQSNMQSLLAQNKLDATALKNEIKATKDQQKALQKQQAAAAK